jgi:hypothetical protein
MKDLIVPERSFLALAIISPLTIETIDFEGTNLISISVPTVASTPVLTTVS